MTEDLLSRHMESKHQVSFDIAVAQTESVSEFLSHKVLHLNISKTASKVSIPDATDRLIK